MENEKSEGCGPGCDCGTRGADTAIRWIAGAVLVAGFYFLVTF